MTEKVLGYQLYLKTSVNILICLIVQFFEISFAFILKEPIEPARTECC